MGQRSKPHVVVTRPVLATILAASCVALWFVPPLASTHFSERQLAWLSWLGPSVYVAMLAATFAWTFAGWRWSPDDGIAVGVYLLSQGAAFLTGVVFFNAPTFDRFAPLFLVPVVAVPFAIASLLAGLAQRVDHESLVMRLVVATSSAVIGAALIAAWLVVRGPSEWLQAPYGFDIYVLAGVTAVAVVGTNRSIQSYRLLRRYTRGPAGG